MTILSDYADVLYDALPCDTYEQMCAEMQNTFTFFTTEMVNNTLHFIRTHQDDDDPLNPGFNVIYVKRGRPGIDETGRFYASNKNDPSFKLDDDQRDHFDSGIAMAIMSSDTTIRNAISMLEAGQVHEVKRVYREAYEDLVFALQGMVRATKRAKRMINEKRAANGGGGST
jgi:hypothetical protein